MPPHPHTTTPRIRPERAADHEAIRALNDAAFKTPTEGRLIATLRALAHPLISLVAVEDDAVIGHILFSPITLPGAPATLRVMGLGPMAVAPPHQRRGVGSALARAGLAACADRSVGAVVVLGHPDYYPRFGFVPASRFGLDCEYEVPDEVFMALELTPGHLASASGTLQYHEAFKLAGV